MKKTEAKRKFLGKLTGFTSKAERNFENKHLKQYLKGNKKFVFGKGKDGKSAIFDVKEEWS